MAVALWHHQLTMPRYRRPAAPVSQPRCRRPAVAYTSHQSTYIVD